MDPKISVVIPVYNGENYLRDAINSVLAQTYTNYEILVINDGSTDSGKTARIANSFKGKIKYFEKENAGVASALNMGIRFMTGEYFSWLSHDDMYYPDKLELQIKALKNSGDMVAPLYGEANYLVMPEGKVQLNKKDCRLSSDQMQNSVFPVLFGKVNGCTTLIHKSHFERVGLFNEKLLTSQDYDMWFRIFRNQRLVYVNKPLLKYRIHKEQGSNTIHEFSENCQQMHLHMIEQLSQNEVEGMFGSKYKLYFDMYQYALECKWGALSDILLRMFLEEEEPEPVTYNKKNERLILYCAGRNGIRLKKELYIRNISVDYFADSNHMLWNSIIDGIPCIAPQDIRRDDNIIVTKDNPEELVERLRNNGYINVKSFTDIEHKVFKMNPVKEKVLRVL